MPPSNVHRTLVPLLNREVVDRVIQQGIDLSKGSWEISTLLQARPELDDPHLTPFGPGQTYQSPDSLKALPIHLVDTASNVLRAGPTAEGFPAGKGKVLCRDDAAGDPASLGIACLLYALAEREDVRAGTKTEGQIAKANDVGMLEAVELEANFLEEDACRSEDGAISHRLGHLSLWADFVYMVPPFFAFKGLASSSTKEQVHYFELGYDQCRLYRQSLRRSDGLWKHIILGPDKIDPWPWATSNGWVAAGMLRVFATMDKAEEAVRQKFRSHMTDLATWAQEIVRVASKHVVRTDGTWAFALRH